MKKICELNQIEIASVVGGTSSYVDHYETGGKIVSMGASIILSRWLLNEWPAKYFTALGIFLTTRVVCIMVASIFGSALEAADRASAEAETKRINNEGKT